MRGPYLLVTPTGPAAAIASMTDNPALWSAPRGSDEADFCGGTSYTVNGGVDVNPFDLCSFDDLPPPSDVGACRPVGSCRATFAPRDNGEPARGLTPRRSRDDSPKANGVFTLSAGQGAGHRGVLGAAVSFGTRTAIRAPSSDCGGFPRTVWPRRRRSPTAWLGYSCAIVGVHLGALNDPGLVERAALELVAFTRPW